MLDYFSQVKLEFPIFILGILFFNQWVEDHYGEFSERLFKISNRLSLFRIVRFSFITCLIFMCIHYLFNRKIGYGEYEYSYLKLAVNNIKENFLQYLLILFSFASLIFLLRKNRIKRNLLRRNESSLNNVYLRYILYVIIKAIFITIVFILIHSVVSVIDSWLIKHHIFPITEFENPYELKNNIDTAYKRGIYHSLLITILSLLFLLNVLLKRMDIGIRDKKAISTLAIIVTSGGIYAGSYAIFNTYLNIQNETFPNWTDEDKLLGHYSIKITALILLWNLLVFIFKHIYGRSFSLLLKHGLFPTKINYQDAYRLERDEYDINGYFSRYYFSQVGFYILNIFLAEILIISAGELKWLFIFFSLQPIIVDDYLVIHYYFERGSNMSLWHRSKKELFNLAMFSLSIILLVSNSWWILMSIYLIFSITLYLIYPDRFLRGIINQ
jgi:hypothetical protein